MSDMALLRIGILAAGLLLIVAIFFFGKPQKPPQARRKGAAAKHAGTEGFPESPADLNESVDPALARDVIAQGELELSVPSEAPRELGKRPQDGFDKLVTLYVAARADRKLHGEDIVVAAEKAGLTYGYMQVFHRLVESKASDGPIFSMASILKPGNFEMDTISDMETPAIAFFMTLPGPLPALDAWEKMEPTAQRMAELLDGVLLDDSRNALGRQRVAHIRDELRAYDRQCAEQGARVQG